MWKVFNAPVFWGQIKLHATQRNRGLVNPLKELPGALLKDTTERTLSEVYRHFRVAASLGVQHSKRFCLRLPAKKLLSHLATAPVASLDATLH